MACRLASSVTLQALIAAVNSSPVVVRLSRLRITPSEWGRIRNSSEVDAFVLAWIASHVPASHAVHPTH